MCTLLIFFRFFLLPLSDRPKDLRHLDHILKFLDHVFRWIQIRKRQLEQTKWSSWKILAGQFVSLLWEHRTTPFSWKIGGWTGGIWLMIFHQWIHRKTMTIMAYKKWVRSIFLHVAVGVPLISSDIFRSSFNRIFGWAQKWTTCISCPLHAWRLSLSQKRLPDHRPVGLVWGGIKWKLMSSLILVEVYWQISFPDFSGFRL